MASRRVRIKGMANIPQRRKQRGNNVSDDLGECNDENVKSGCGGLSGETTTCVDKLQEDYGEKPQENYEKNLQEDRRCKPREDCGRKLEGDDGRKLQGDYIEQVQEDGRRKQEVCNRQQREDQERHPEEVYVRKLQEDSESKQRDSKINGEENSGRKQLEDCMKIQRENWENGQLEDNERNCKIKQNINNKVECKERSEQQKGQNEEQEKDCEIATFRVQSEDTRIEQENPKISKRQEDCRSKLESRNNSNTTDEENGREILNDGNFKEPKETQNQPLIRRRFLKPTILASQIKRKKTQPSNEIVPENQSKESEKILNLNETVLPAACSNNIEVEPKRALQVTSNFRKPSVDEVKSSSDTECPAPPASPTKFLQRRIKAVPRLNNQRRISFNFHGSASESEDDSRKTYSRVRTDSVCSVASSHGVPENPQSVDVTQKNVVGKTVQRKWRRTDQYRKLVEARREFERKFFGSKPDRQKLTMMDLIFYNPTTNLMSENKKKRQDSTSTMKTDDNLPENEIVDDPLEESQEENEDLMPAPQIKIGANGEIVVDEQSLVIENESTKANREALQKSEVIDGDFDAGVGYMKKARTRKLWSRSETLRFYRALNTIGTDFMLMCQLFPGRKRSELKLKFKKEEKINKNLIDKAMLQPKQFDMDQLVKDLEREEKEAEDKKRSLMKIRQENKSKRVKVLNNICVAQPNKLEKNPQKDNKTNVEERNRKNKEIELKLPQRKSDIQSRSTFDYIKDGILGVLKENKRQEFIEKAKNSYDSDQLASGEESSEDEVINLQRKPTRVGRLPKPRQMLSDTLEDLKIRKRKLNTKQEEKGEEVKKPKFRKRQKTRRRTKINDISDDSKQPNSLNSQQSEQQDEQESPELEPGSIMVITSQTTPEEDPVYQLFMVTPDRDKVQLDLTPEVVQSFVLNLNALPENNVTIPEDGCDSLRPVGAQTKEDLIVLLGDGEKVLDGDEHESLRVIEVSESVECDGENVETGGEKSDGLGRKKLVIEANNKFGDKANDKFENETNEKFGDEAIEKCEDETYDKFEDVS